MIKKFKATDMKDAIKLVKQQLGENAVILQTKKVKGDHPLDFLKPEMIEITAMVEDGKQPRPKPSEQLSDPSRRPPAEKPVHQPYGIPRVRATRNGTVGSTQATGELTLELKELRETVARMHESFRFSRHTVPPRMFSHLVEKRGVEEDLAAELLQEVIIALNEKELQDKGKIQWAFLKAMSNYLNIKNQLEVKRKTPKLILLVGPTGMGKTTTICKLATHPELYGTHRVGLITIDTYRMAAAAQLKTFATLANLPLEIVYKPEEFGAAVEKLSNREVILIDTAGRSPLNLEYVQHLRNFIGIRMPDEIHLVFSISMRADNLVEAARGFSTLPVNHVIFSKLDETERIGNILNVAKKVRLPISFLTDGQIIPDDVHLADKQVIANAILN